MNSGIYAAGRSKNKWGYSPRLPGLWADPCFMNSDCLRKEKNVELFNTFISEEKVYIFSPGLSWSENMQLRWDCNWWKLLRSCHRAERLCQKCRWKPSDGHAEPPRHQWCNKSTSGSQSGGLDWLHIHQTWIIKRVSGWTQLSIPESLFIEHQIMAIYSTVHYLIR